MLLGDRLVQAGILTPEEQAYAVELHQAWGVPIGEAIRAQGWVDQRAFHQVLAQHLHLSYVDVDPKSIHNYLLEKNDLQFYTHSLIMPWRYEDGRLTVVVADPSPKTLALVARKYGQGVGVVVTTRDALRATLQTHFREDLMWESTLSLNTRDPNLSAKTVVNKGQIVGGYLALVLLALAFTFEPGWTAAGLVSVMSAFYVGNFIFRAALVWAASNTKKVDEKVSDIEVASLDDADLPVYTILVPLYKEAGILPSLIDGMRKLDWPAAKLDIKIILEEDDVETREVVANIDFEEMFDIITVPTSLPKTKPKACNYAFQFARGEYTVIFDAEDQPEPDQLKKVYCLFKKSDSKLGCIQARLNFFNSRENWLSRMFTLDYSLWFDYYLPGLERLGIPLPLGGTSNHFPTWVLKELGAWDPYNVTEDADLGIRMTQKGYHVTTINSTTFEEANPDFWNWIRQRSRWIKGFMQTYLVHMRQPLNLLKESGVKGFIGFQLFVGGTILTGLLNPVFWLIFLVWLVTGTKGFDALFPGPMLYIGLASLLIGNGLFIYLSMIGPFKRGWLHLTPFGLSVVAYWGMISLSAYLAAWQLVTKPFYWEKTTHGISKYRPATQSDQKELTTHG
ncbi:glycosyltransferase [bacterium AH-315-P15]|nr:glycosyltransferase [bacterium AH-315-P15]